MDYKSLLKEEDLDRMTDLLHHRGPDGRGVQILSGPNYSVGLGHRRLSIIDLSDLGSQPMSYNHLSIVFNGEIYNYIEIREKLKDFGHTFKTNSDTEVILHAFSEWGKGCVDYFHGMWAFAVYDSANHELILCRDRLGVKPLYYSTLDGNILFASEMKCFYNINGYNKSINNSSVGQYFNYGYINAPFTIFENTYKVKPGSFITISADYKIQEKLYWKIDQYDELDFYSQYSIRDGNEAERVLEDILIKSFKMRLVSDVPVGMFLSGGIDSSLLAALLQRNSSTQIKTFTIGFNEKKYNEAKIAKMISETLGTDHYEFLLDAEKAKKYILDIPKFWDEPFGDSSAIPSMLISKMTSDYVTVSLSADGGDELFMGYNRYFKYLRRKDSFIVRNLRNWNNKVVLSNVFNFKFKRTSTYIPLLKFAGLFENKTGLQLYEDQINCFGVDNAECLGFPKHNYLLDNLYLDNSGSIENILKFDMLTYLSDDILTKVDRATMSVGLEGREPYLDQDIVKFAMLLPLKYKYKGNQGKLILRNILKKYISENIINLPKRGFSIPEAQWMQNDFKDIFRELLIKATKRLELYDLKRLSKDIEMFLKGKRNYHHLYWYIFMFELWREEYNLS